MKFLLSILVLLVTTIANAQNIGINTTTPLRTLHINSGTFLITGDTGTAPALTSGPKFFWASSKRAFRAGSTSSTQWDNDNLGEFSFAFGSNSNASNSYSMAGGQGTIVSSTHSIGVGTNVTVSGQNSAAFGNGNTAANPGTFVAGQGNTANGFYSTALGNGTQANALGSLVIGRYNTLAGTNNSWVAAEPAFVIGNGSLNPVSGIVTRSNALTIFKNGDMQLAGNAAISGTAIITGNTIINDSLQVIGPAFITDSLTVSDNIKVIGKINIKEFGMLTSLHVGGGISLKTVSSFYDAPSQTVFQVGDASSITLRVTNGTSPFNVVLGDGVAAGQLLIISGAAGGLTFNFLDDTVNNNTQLTGNKTLNHQDDRLGLMWNGTFWVELFFSNNN